MAVLINFIQTRQTKEIKETKRSPVATGIMLMFLVFFYLLIINRILVLKSLTRFYNPLSTIGYVLLLLGTIVNILGRINLNKNWSNQVVVYKDHKLVQNGIYKLIRHPLYGSLMWMFYGASLIYLNLAAFLANTLIFVPMMYYRAKQEEVALQKQFPEYTKYKKKTGMFFPKINLF
jgi:protein-S-isoprenylcysteine O-methyltransferase Ste14